MTDGYLPTRMFYGEITEGMMRSVWRDLSNSGGTSFSDLPIERATLLRQNLSSIVKARNEMNQVDRDLGDAGKGSKDLDPDKEYDLFVQNVNEGLP